MMEKLFDFIIWTVIFVAGYYVGNREARKDVKIVKDKLDEFKLPEPGLVRKLTEDQLAEKKNPVAKGNLEAFNEFFKRFPIKK